MVAIFNSFLLVAVTEMGDKTQLLAFVLASRFRQPFVILAGIFVATVLNHVLAASLGSWVSQSLSPQTLRWILGGAFILFAGWILIPDKDDDEGKNHHRFGPFLTTLITFFLAEMGDKTQLSTVALAAKYKDLVQVTVGTTLGMMFSDGLAVFFGERLTEKIPLKWVRIFAAGLFILFGLGIILETVSKT